MDIFWFLLFFTWNLAYGKEQTVRVFGRVTCNRRSYEGAVIRLMEKDVLDPDDELATVTSNNKGRFDLTGKEDETFDLEPFLLIEHRCKVKELGCKRVAKLPIPIRYINSKEGYNMTYLALDIWLGEKEKC